MTLGTNSIGETSVYIFNGLGHLVSQVWTIKKNAYGYTNVNSSPAIATFNEFIAEYADDVSDYIESLIGSTPDPLDGLDHDQPLVIITDPNAPQAPDEANFMLPEPVIQALNNGNQIIVVRKDFVLDYTSALKNIIMEQESGAGNLTYRYTYGLEKIAVSLTPVTGGAGGIVQGNRVKLWYHQNRLGSTDYLTDNIDGKVTSYVTYDDFGAPTMKAIIKLGLRELDLVTE
jgi:hypothetical protein